MSLHTACSAILPAYCEYADLAAYLLPSALLALLIRFLAGKHPFFFLLTLAGTFCHELAHFCIGFLTFARPSSIDIIPRRMGRNWKLGSVGFGNICWYNAALTALAPLAIVAIPFLVAAWRVHPGWTFETMDIPIAFFLAPQFLSFWPSSTDWRIALRSWPYAVIAAMAYWAWQAWPIWH